MKDTTLYTTNAMYNYVIGKSICNSLFQRGNPNYSVYVVCGISASHATKQGKLCGNQHCGHICLFLLFFLY